MVNDDLAGELAAAVRDAYFTEIQRFYTRRGERSAPRGNRRHARWDGGTDANDHTHTAVWPRIVRFALDNGVSPTDLVQACFATWRGKGPPEPGRISGDWGLQTAREWQETKRDKVVFELKSCSNRAELFYHVYAPAWDNDPPRTWRQVLCSAATDLTALFRHCMIHQGGFEDLYDLYEDRALDAYLWSRAYYDDVWGDLIPDQLRGAAAAVTANLRK